MEHIRKGKSGIYSLKIVRALWEISTSPSCLKAWHQVCVGSCFQCFDNSRVHNKLHKQQWRKDRDLCFQAGHTVTILSLCELEMKPLRYTQTHNRECKVVPKCPRHMRTWQNHPQWEILQFNCVIAPIQKRVLVAFPAGMAFSTVGERTTFQPVGSRHMGLNFRQHLVW